MCCLADFSSRCASRGLCEVLAILQYPLTGRTSCNLKVYPPAYFTLPLAVPSHGSNLMQRTRAPLPENHGHHLQYPLSGRTSCNAELYNMPIGMFQLAVPSLGSNLLQPITTGT